MKKVGSRQQADGSKRIKEGRDVLYFPRQLMLSSAHVLKAIDYWSKG
jgi:hypothetical protein